MLKLLAPLFLVSWLIGCGGNSDESTTPTPVIPSLPTQTGSKLQATFNQQDGMLKLEWQDISSSELGYSVEQKVDSAVAAVTSSWVAVEDLPAYSGQGQQITWQKPISSKGEYRVLVKLAGQNKVLLTEGSAQSLVVSPSVDATIVFSQAEPVHDTVGVSIHTTGITPKSVTYYSDLAFQGTLTTAPNFTLGYIASRQIDGSHLITAKIEVTPNNYVLIQRQIQVDNPDLSMQINSTTNLKNWSVTATSKTGIKEIVAYLDNQPIDLLTPPKKCSFPNSISETCAFNIDLNQLAFGSHELKFIAKDNGGEVLEQSRVFIKNSTPVINLDTPANGQLTGKTLHIAGSITDDEDDPLLVIYLRDLEIYRGVGKQFSVNYDLTSLPPGNYAIKLNVTPKSGTGTNLVVNVDYPAQNVAPEYLYDLGKEGFLLDVDQDRVLSSDGTFNVFLSQPSSARLPLDLGSVLTDFVVDAQLVDGKVLFVPRNGNEQTSQVYLWDGGALKNISEISGANSAGITTKVRVFRNGNWLVWPAQNATSEGYYLYNFVTKESHFAAILPAGGSVQMGDSGQSLVILPDTLRLYVWAYNGYSNFSKYDVFQYDSKTNTTTRLTDNGLVNLNTHSSPKANTTRLVWQQRPNSDAARFSLFTAPVDNPFNQLQLSNSGLVENLFWLDQNLLVWGEVAGTQRQLRANDGVNQFDLLPSLNNYIQGVGGGKVVYASDIHKTSVWQPGKQPYQLYGFSLKSAKFDRTTGILYFTVGEANSLYRIALP